MAEHPAEKTKNVEQPAAEAAKPKKAEEQELVVRSMVAGTKLNSNQAKLVAAHARSLGENSGATVMAIGPTSIVYHGDKIGARKVSTE